MRRGKTHVYMSCRSVTSFPNLARGKITSVTSNSRRMYIIDENRCYPSVTTVLDGIYSKHLIYYEKYMMNQRYRSIVEGDGIWMDEIELAFKTEDKESVLQWFDKLFRAVNSAAGEHTEAAATLGSRTHKCINDLIKSNRLGPEERETVLREIEDFGVDLKVPMHSFLHWYDNSGLTLDQIGDQPVYSDLHKYAGSLDCLAMANEKDLVILDFKTSQSLNRTHNLQIAAYAKAVEEMTGLPVYKAGIIRLNKGNKSPGFQQRFLDRDQIRLAFNTFVCAAQLSFYEKVEKNKAYSDKF